MARIDDPLDQIESQHRDAEQAQALAIGLNVAAPLVEVLTGSPAGSFAALAAIGVQFIADRRKAARAEAFSAALRDALAGLEDRVARVEKLAVGPDAEEAIVEAVRSALSAARLDKARRFGQVVGATFAVASPNWQETAEFIRNLEELGDADLQALQILWRVQRTEYRVMEGAQRGMSTGADVYNKTWKDVLERVEKAGVSQDDWYSRCARLSGFGLALLLRANPSYVGPDDTCCRLTSRAVRLLGLLGKNINPGAYPAVRYHADGRRITVEDEDEERELGDGWADTPAAFQKA